MYRFISVYSFYDIINDLFAKHYRHILLVEYTTIPVRYPKVVSNLFRHIKTWDSREREFPVEGVKNWNLNLKQHLELKQVLQLKPGFYTHTLNTKSGIVDPLNWRDTELKE